MRTANSSLAFLEDGLRPVFCMSRSRSDKPPVSLRTSKRSGYCRVYRAFVRPHSALLCLLYRLMPWNNSHATLWSLSSIGYTCSVPGRLPRGILFSESSAWSVTETAIVWRVICSLTRHYWSSQYTVVSIFRAYEFCPTWLQMAGTDILQHFSCERTKDHGVFCLFDTL